MPTEQTLAFVFKSRSLVGQPVEFLVFKSIKEGKREAGGLRLAWATQ